MNKLLILPLLLLTLLVGTPAFSADFQKGQTAYRSGDYATALRELTPLAEQGDARAQTGLGWMYLKGQGVPKNHKTAVKWYRLAAEQGNAIAQSNLGFMYANGTGVPKDYVRAHMWYHIAASSGKSKKASKNRDIVAGKMTPAQIAEAQKLARECVRKKYKGCIAVLLGSVGVSLGNDSRQESVASNAARCSSFYLIATSAFGSNKAAAKSLMGIQRLFDGLYSAKERGRTRQRVTNGMISKVKSNTALKLGRAYDRNPMTIYSLEMSCDLWRQKIVQVLQTAKRRGVDAHSTFLTMDDIPSSPASSDPRWSRSKVFVDNALSAWTNLGRVTPYQMKQELMRKLRK
jgi:TPR repeat protein